MIGCWPCLPYRRASLAAVVVLPEPCSPISMITVGGCEAGARRCPLPPSSSISSSCTTFTTCWAGVSDLRTSWPTAFSRTRSTKPRTTLKLTSASSSATRTSRRASWMLSSLSRPRPPSRSKIDCSLALRESSMERRSLRNYAEHYNSSGAVGVGEERAGSGSGAQAHPDWPPLQGQHRHREGQHQGGDRHPEVHPAPAGPPVPAADQERPDELQALPLPHDERPEESHADLRLRGECQLRATRESRA